MQTTAISQFWIPVSARVYFNKAVNGFFVQGIDNECIFGQIPHLADPLFLAIHDKQLCAGACKLCRQRFPEAPKSDNTVCYGIFFLFSKHNILISERFARIFFQ